MGLITKKVQTSESFSMALQFEKRERVVAINRFAVMGRESRRSRARRGIASRSVGGLLTLESPRRLPPSK